MAVTEYKNKKQKPVEQKTYGQMLRDARRPDKKEKTKKGSKNGKKS